MEFNISDYKFNTVKHRGDPKSAVLESGHTVKKQEYVYFKDEHGQYVALKCADYHGAHFLYLDPVFNDDEKGKGHWFAMCTCGAPAVIVGPQQGDMEDTGVQERLLVCYAYHLTLHNYGAGWHQGSSPRRWQ